MSDEHKAKNKDESVGQASVPGGLAGGSDLRLQATLRGADPGLAEGKLEKETRLCPGCSAVTEFVNGKCSNCDFKLGTAGQGPQSPFHAPAARADNPALKIVLIVLIVGVLVAAVAMLWPRISGSPSDTGGESSSAAAPPGGSTASGGSFPGDLDELSIDEAFHEDLKDALRVGSLAWEEEGVDCYVYRYKLYEETVPTISRTIRITAYVGGEDAAAAARPPGDAPFRMAISSYTDSVNEHPGVEASIRLVFTDGAEPPATSDVYVRYGYYFGKEHMDDLQPIIDALRWSKENEGQYPVSLSKDIVSPSIRTNGNINFIPRGFGYIPVFKVDSGGNVIMGHGKGRAAFLPEECLSYYLVMFTKKSSEGLDMLSPQDIAYYTDKISRFPYKPSKPIQNMPMNPDGEPDGIACIVRNGILLK
ncbi:hypothetical protein IIA79_02435 [bacterium]|nr:hypothetical protein [bacterium]